MATPAYVESLVSSVKRLRISQPKYTPTIRTPSQFQASSTVSKSSNARSPVAQRSASTSTAVAQLGQDAKQLRLPKAVQAVFLAPLKRAPKYGIPVCDLQIRSYSVRNLEVFTDFCLRAAYYLDLPAKGPVPLPRIVERWTVPKSNFIFKKSQENFERKTLRRLIQIQDGHPDTVALWLAYIQKHRYYGVGMKANVFEHGPVDAGVSMDEQAERALDHLNKNHVSFGGRERYRHRSAARYDELLFSGPFKSQWSGITALTRPVKPTASIEKRDEAKAKPTP